MENKNIITFCSCKPSQKKQCWGSWKFTGSYEKCVEVLGDLQDTISKDREVNKLWQKLFNQH